jgi:hypothetical protein
LKEFLLDVRGDFEIEAENEEIMDENKDYYDEKELDEGFVNEFIGEERVEKGESEEFSGFKDKEFWEDSKREGEEVSRRGADEKGSKSKIFSEKESRKATFVEKDSRVEGEIEKFSSVSAEKKNKSLLEKDKTSNSSLIAKVKEETKNVNRNKTEIVGNDKSVNSYTNERVNRTEINNPAGRKSPLRYEKKDTIPNNDKKESFSNKINEKESFRNYVNEKEEFIYDQNKKESLDDELYEKDYSVPRPYENGDLDENPYEEKEKSHISLEKIYKEDSKSISDPNLNNKSVAESQKNRSFLKKVTNQSDNKDDSKSISPNRSQLHKSVTSIESKPDSPLKQLSKKFTNIKEDSSDSSSKPRKSPVSTLKLLEDSQQKIKNQEPKNSKIQKKSSRSSSSDNENQEKSSVFLSGLNLAKKAIDEIREEKKAKKKSSDSESSSKSKPEPSSLVQQHLLSLGRSETKPGWFNNMILHKEPHFSSIFSRFCSSKPYTTTKELPQLFKVTVEELEVPINGHHEEVFKEIYSTLHPMQVIQKPKSKPKTIYPQIIFPTFVELMNLWGEKYSKEQATVLGQLSKTVKEYQLLIETPNASPVIRSIVENTSKALEKMLVNLVGSHKEELPLKEKFKKNLEDLFQFYAKVQKNQGTEDTFESIEASNTTLILSKEKPKKNEC